MEGANDAKNATIVVGADESSVSTTGFQASLESGKSSDFIKKAALKSIGDLGHSRARLKSDQAPTVVEILRSMKKRRSTVRKDHTNQTDGSQVASGTCKVWFERSRVKRFQAQEMASQPQVRCFLGW